VGEAVPISRGILYVDFWGISLALYSRFTAPQLNRYAIENYLKKL
jgi:hypothetical protein